MRNNKKIISIFCCLLLAGTVFAASKKSAKYVSSDSLPVKEKASAKGKTLCTLTLGDVVQVVEEKKDWTKITCEDGTTGWVSTKSITSKKQVAGDTKVSADAKEIALAGKGFTEDIEKAYSEQFDTNYDLVNDVECNGVLDMFVFDFMQEGQLKSEEEE